MFFTDGKRRKKTHIPTTFFEPQILFSRTRNFYNSTSGRDKQKTCATEMLHTFSKPHIHRFPTVGNHCSSFGLSSMLLFFNFGYIFQVAMKAAINPMPHPTTAR